MFKGISEIKECKELALKISDLCFPGDDNTEVTPDESKIACMSATLFIAGLLRKEPKQNAHIVIGFIADTVGVDLKELIKD